MPRYYCDYCDTYLTHDSPVVRKQHNTGYKHKANVRNYYMQFEEAQTQELIDSKIMEHLAKAGAPGPGQVPLVNGPPNGMPMRPQMGGYPTMPPQSIPYRPPAGMGPPGPGQAQPYRPQSMAPPQYAGYAPR